jgi:hypothetical protein
VLSLALTSCAGIQTEPTCKVEQFGLIAFHNQTDEYKEVGIFRVVHDGTRYKTVGPPVGRTVPPMVEATIRISPGMVLVVIDTINGERWMKVFLIHLCGKNRIDMSNPVVFKDFEIKSRRHFDNDCDLCECPILGLFGRFANTLLSADVRFNDVPLTPQAP